MALHENPTVEGPRQPHHGVEDMVVTEKFSAPAQQPSSEVQLDGSSDTVTRPRSSSENQPSSEVTETNEDAAAKEMVKGGGDGNPLDRVPSQAQKLGGKKIAVVMGALCLVLFLAALDMTIISTALPTMAADFNASESGYSWMASSFSLTNAAFVPLWGKVSDIWGRKPILLLANLAFLIGSLICALAKNLPMVLAGRSIQGAGAGGIITLANICVSDLFSVRERPMYYALFGTTWAIAGALGPLVGGAFTTSVTWRWCFYLNLPIGGVSFAILFFFLTIESPKTPLWAGIRTIDWSGVILIVGATLMFLFGLQFGGVNYPWNSATVICLIVFGLFTYVLAMLNEWRIARYPVIPLRLFTNSHNIFILLICFVHSMVFMGGSYYLPFYFQSVLLVSPILSGVYVLPQVLSLSVMSIVTGILIRKTGRYRELIIAAFFFLTLGYGLLINLQPYASWPRIIIYQLIGGFGTGPLFQAPLVALQANIHPSDMAAGTSTFSFLRQVSASISIVIGTVIYQNILVSKNSSISAAVGPETAAALSSSFAENSHELIRSLPKSEKDVVLDVFNFSLSRIWIFYAAMAGVGLLVSILVKPVELSKTHTVTKTGLEEQERARKEILAAQAKARGAREEGNEKETV
ncbi:major facilitator superfamily domain-containing protein [Aspergillus pseudoustus]|uniref:Major facilitator superfamily domain-containing protein n=1 Tax=Aspergillus pseudoustus TaxID=1810923 RepID=A0ABR4K4F8_9EURO